MLELGPPLSHSLLCHHSQIENGRLLSCFVGAAAQMASIFVVRDAIPKAKESTEALSVVASVVCVSLLTVSATMASREASANVCGDWVKTIVFS